MTNLTQAQRNLAAQEVASAASRGDRVTAQAVTRIAAGDSTVDRAKFASDVLVTDAKQIAEAGRFWPG